MEAMQLGEGHRVVTIASGGCNMLAYLTRSPAAIDAVDLNTAHIALNRLKLAAVRHLPSQADLFRFFGEHRQPPQSARPTTVSSRRISTPRRAATGRSAAGAASAASRSSSSNFYRTGLLGLFIGIGHRVARLYGVDPAEIMKADGLREQRRFFEEELAPLFDRRLLRWATSLKGLAVRPRHPAGAVRFAGHRRRRHHGARAVERLEKLACDFPLKDNYFAWQAFARRYPAARRGRPARLSRGAQLRDDPRQCRPRRTSTTPISSNCSPASRPAASTATSCSTRRTG